MKHVKLIVIMVLIQLLFSYVCAYAQSLNPILNQEISFQIQRFLKLSKVYTLDSAIINKNTIINFVNFDSNEVSEFLPNTEIVVSTRIRWIPAMDTPLLRDNVDVLHVERIPIDKGGFKIIFVWRQFVITDRKKLIYVVYTNENGCFPSIIMLKG